MRHFEQQVVGIVVIPRPSDALDQVVRFTKQYQALVVVKINAPVAEAAGGTRRGAPLERSEELEIVQREFAAITQAVLIDPGLAQLADEVDGRRAFPELIP